MDSSNVTLMTREPTVAGKFYPGSATVLRNELQRLFKGLSPPPDVDKTLAIISPHAGYIFSGNVAASGFMHIDPNKDYNNVFVIGSSHHVVFEGASVYTRGNFKTPLGVVQVNTKLSRELTASSIYFTDRSEVHHDEHSLEVQLPFLQFRLKKPFQIVPLIIGTREPSTCKKMADTLRPYFNHSNLFIVSTDFSHYPDYEDACRIDKRTVEAIISNEPEVLFKAIMGIKKDEIPGLSTCLCGWTSVLTLMHITRKIPGINYNLLNYQNSGDAPYNRKSSVVGYCSVSITQNEKQNPVSDEITALNITAEDRKILLSIAREAIISCRSAGKPTESGFLEKSSVLLQHAGAFVSIYKQGKLRGCIGKFVPDSPIYEVVKEMAIASSTRDRRFTSVKPDEIPLLRIEISILTPLRKIESIDDIVLGKHGIFIKKGSYSGTYLPQVAINTGWSRQEFLEHCSAEKAGIGRNGWKDAELYIYEALVIREE